MKQDIKLHLGCGKRYIPGFVHVDLDSFPHIDYQSDVAHLPMFEDESVSLIYSSHTLEYFDRIEVQEVLKEWRRVLRPGGILRVAVPDFEALVKVYQQHGDLGKIVGPLYGRIIIKTPDGEKAAYHKTVYDFKALKDVLEQAGFKNVQRYDWRNTIHRDYDDFSQAYIPHMDKEHGLLISLNVEGKRA